MVEMRVHGVRVELPAEVPVLLLQEIGGTGRIIPIFIAENEAQHIVWALNEVDHPRPLTYDLFVEVLQRLGAALTHVLVTDMHSDTYFAELHLRLGSATHVVSCRPSDATNLALRSGCPIFCNDEVVDSWGQVVEEADGAGLVMRRLDVPEALEEGQAEELVDELAEWLQNIKPEDFG
jgi:bifunctional DNase/RNase